MISSGYCKISSQTPAGKTLNSGSGWVEAEKVRSGQAAKPVCNVLVGGKPSPSDLLRSSPPSADFQSGRRAVTGSVRHAVGQQPLDCPSIEDQDIHYPRYLSIKKYFNTWSWSSKDTPEPKQHFTTRSAGTSHYKLSLTVTQLSSGITCYRCLYLTNELLTVPLIKINVL